MTVLVQLDEQTTVVETDPTQLILETGATEVILEVDQQKIIFTAPIPFGGGEANDLANAGTGGGESLVASPSKVGADLQLRGLRGKDGIAVTEDAADEELVVGTTVAGGAAPWVEDEFTPTAAQVTFILSQAPLDPNSLTFEANGIMADDTTDFTRSGVTITWLNTLFVMAATDKVHVRYK